VRRGLPTQKFSPDFYFAWHLKFTINPGKFLDWQPFLPHFWIMIGWNNIQHLVLETANSRKQKRASQTFFVLFSDSTAL